MPSEEVPVEAQKIRESIEANYSLEEIRSLCEPLGIDHENIEGTTKNVKARELVRYCVRKGKLNELAKIVADNQAQNTVINFDGSKSFRDGNHKKNKLSNNKLVILLLITSTAIVTLFLSNLIKNLNSTSTALSQLPSPSATSSVESIGSNTYGATTTVPTIPATVHTPPSISTITSTPTLSSASPSQTNPTDAPLMFSTKISTPFGKVIEPSIVYFFPSTNSDSRGVIQLEEEVTILGKTENDIWLNVLATFNEVIYSGWLEYDTVELQDHWNIEFIPTVMTVPVPPPTSTSPPPATPTIPIPEDNNTSRPPNNNSSNESKEPDNPTPEKKPTTPPTGPS